MIQTEIPCSSCGLGLIEIDFNREYYLRQCDNARCPEFKGRQGVREKSLAEVIGEPEIKKPSISHTDRPGYETWLEEKRKNYRLLRNLGVPPKEAARDCSRKKARATVKRLEEKV